MGMLRERLRYTWTAHFAKPASQRCLHRAVRRHQVQRILEFGIGDTARARALIRTAAMDRLADGGTADITYAAVDLFEARTALSIAGDSTSDETRSLPLKEAYQRLKATGAQIRLLPGDPYSALARGANDLGQLDMIILNADVDWHIDAETPDPAWFYVPRLLHDETEFWVARRENDGEIRYEQMPLADVHALGRQAQTLRHAASAANRGNSVRRAA